MGYRAGYTIRAYKKGKKWPVYRSGADSIDLALLGAETALLIVDADSVIIRKSSKEDG